MSRHHVASLISSCVAVGALAVTSVLPVASSRAAPGGAIEAAASGSPLRAANRGAMPTTTPVGSVLPIDSTIRVDQFGYLPDATKVAVIAGVTSPRRFEVRRSDGVVAFDASSTVWNDGAIDPQSGQRGSVFDFSSVTSPGTYEVIDTVANTSSGPFVIGADAYDDVLDTAMRVFWFNRGNVEHAAALAGPWAQPATLIGPGQDTEARWVDARQDASTARDLSGGWYDAGDTNKYVSFAVGPVHQLLETHRSYPEVFDDASGIPESGNGIPDILDEVRVELEWLEKMQDPDGGVLVKVGFIDYDDASSVVVDDRPRYYEEACSSSTIAAAGMYAHGARSFASIDSAFADRLRMRAEDAWDWYADAAAANERSADCDPQIVKAGDADRSLIEQDRLEVVAAVHLYALTGEPWFHNIVIEYVEELSPFIDRSLGRYNPEDAIALLTYRDVPDADPGTVARIDALLAELPFSAAAVGYDPSASLHQSYMPDAQYHWGSNMVMANTGNANFELLRTGTVDDDRSRFARRGSAHLHTLHGVNPLGLVPLSNMGADGAERSLEEIYHFWFADGTAYDNASTSSIGPAPGYVSGGPNASYSGSVPLAGSAPALSYRDWNSSGDADRSWEISEPAIYYQSAYVALLAAVMSGR